jgi:Ala-tRNA(Pro) deacylase
MFIEQYLNSHHINAQLHDHPVAYTAHQLAEVEHVPDTMVAKVVLFFINDQMAMGVLPANRNLNLHLTEHATEANRVRLATEREIAERIQGVELGAVPPFGSLFGLPVYMDDAFTNTKQIFVPGGLLTQSLTIRMDDYLREETPRVAKLSRGPIHRKMQSKNKPYKFEY